ncbi:tryptophan--tRNA ligase [Mycoplasmopsis pullorum]|uniref:Tryptophan--tRNA ligase n=1 Tax=Mycoplasmopsis pullorum TaxID=48003 RepID=A0A1L4FRL0_9BACT|nr:tryptophan--tRNA ligase [Mycoplasmopsis pullorum]APJ38234.1 tryptophan--tRNA ligase [Mycoplasmopsis pullorum]
MKKRLISGIKPTGDLTLGNYLGAIKNFIKMQREYETYVFVADLHALTTGDNKPEELLKRRKEIVAIYLACGLDPKVTTIFYQSDVLEHGMMQWLLSNETALGELERMTQFKDKAQKAIKQANGTEKIPTGLLMYPTLMAGDILLYNVDCVPVGEDQIQHLELTRTIAARMNKKYNFDFKIPKAVLPQVGAKIKSLSNPEVKMSKSELSQKGTIYLLEDPESAYKKIMKSVTDSENKVYISDEKPGVLNLLTIYAAIKDISLEEAERIFASANYKDFKHEVATVVKEELIKIQTKYNEALTQIEQVSKEGAIKAQEVAKDILDRLMRNMGFK